MDCHREGPQKEVIYIQTQLNLSHQFETTLHPFENFGTMVNSMYHLETTY